MIKCKCGTYRRYGDEIAGRNIAKSMHLDACMNCGYIPSQSSNIEIKDDKTRLGDVVSNTLNTLGVNKVTTAIKNKTGYDCGCNKRQQFLNNLDKKIRG